MNFNIIENIIEDEAKECISTLLLLKKYFQQTEVLNMFRASERAESSVNQFIDLVNTKIEKNSKKNICCLFKEVNKNVTTIDLNYFIVVKIKSEINQLTWQEFEHFCGALMKKCFGASSVNITQSTSDGGVDFEGKIPFKPLQISNPFGWIEFYGQSKKYKGDIQRSHIDTFIAFASKKKRDYKYPAQLFIFCTTSDFITSAEQEILKNNFIGFNGMQLATLVFMYSKNNVFQNHLVKDFMM